MSEPTTNSPPIVLIHGLLDDRPKLGSLGGVLPGEGT
jgi:hypothetical protein